MPHHHQDGFTDFFCAISEILQPPGLLKTGQAELSQKNVLSCPLKSTGVHSSPLMSTGVRHDQEISVKRGNKAERCVTATTYDESFNLFSRAGQEAQEERLKWFTRSNRQERPGASLVAQRRRRTTARLFSSPAFQACRGARHRVADRVHDK
jgi:hypothetical protein